jgi:hypothetical protein
MAERLPPNSMPVARKLLFVGITVLAGALVVELSLQGLFGASELYRRYRWLVDTHLVDVSYSEFVECQERIQQVRSELGMERGRAHPVYGHTYNPSFHIDEPELGLGNASTRISINSHALRLYQLEPDFVTVYHGINDLFYHTQSSLVVAPEKNYSGELLDTFRTRCLGRSRCATRRTARRSKPASESGSARAVSPLPVAGASSKPKIRR